MSLKMLKFLPIKISFTVSNNKNLCFKINNATTRQNMSRAYIDLRLDKIKSFSSTRSLSSLYSAITPTFLSVLGDS